MILSPDPHIRLSPLEERQGTVLFELIDRNRRSLREWLPWLDHQKSVQDTLSFIEFTRRQYELNESLAMGIHFDEVLCGVIAFHRFDWMNRASSIGYWLSKDQQGKGIMTTACRAMLDHGFFRLSLHRVEIRCATGNEKSRRIPERLGFVTEGILRDAEWLYDHYVDLVVYSMLAPAWKSQVRHSS